MPGCSSQRKSANSCKRVCGDARRVEGRKTREKRGCFAIMTGRSTECTA